MAATKTKAPSKGTTVLEFDTDAIKRREKEVAKETDVQILDRLSERFEILEEMTKAVKNGNVRAMIVSGPPGVGKSHLLVALGIRAIELGFSAQYFRFDELMTALKADAHLPASRIKARKYMSTALLLIDEMGYDPMNRQEASLFFRLVSHRYGRGAMIITTNKTVRDWPELLAGDEVLATAILDRLLHRAHVLNIRGRSYRLRDLEASLKN